MWTNANMEQRYQTPTATLQTIHQEANELTYHRQRPGFNVRASLQRQPLPPIEGSSPLIGSHNNDMCEEWAQIMHTLMHAHYWPPTETAYPAEHEAAQPAEHEVVLQQALAAGQQPWHPHQTTRNTMVSS